MTLINYLLRGMGYGLYAAAQPGPFQAFVLSQTLNRGWRRTLPMALAPLISDGPIIALVLLVLNQIPTSLEGYLYLTSGLFVLYLAWGAYANWRRAAGRETPPPSPANHQGLLKAALMNMLSPGPYVFWSLVTGPELLQGWRTSPAHGLGFLGGFYLAMVAGLAGLIVLFGTARHLGPRVNRVLMIASAVALLGFGLYQLWRGLALVL